VGIPNVRFNAERNWNRLQELCTNGENVIMNTWRAAKVSESTYIGIIGWNNQAVSALCPTKTSKRKFIFI
jgi:hypothetical protein